MLGGFFFYTLGWCIEVSFRVGRTCIFLLLTWLPVSNKGEANTQENSHVLIHCNSGKYLDRRRGSRVDCIEIKLRGSFLETLQECECMFQFKELENPGVSAMGWVNLKWCPIISLSPNGIKKILDQTAAYSKWEFLHWHKLTQHLKHTYRNEVLYFWVN